ncbi:MAG: hypothetical protein GC206_04875 [Alphaproteobacteria bacterium]|nr:hypothetical protein [Alphaproteobacteria bacterium]
MTRARAWRERRGAGHARKLGPIDLGSVVLILGVCASAHAQASVLSVSSPSVRAGELTAETGIAFEEDRASDLDGFSELAIEFGYSPTAHWKVAIELAAEDAPGADAGYAVSALKNTFALARQGDAAPFDVGLRLQYEFAHIDGEADEAAARLLLRRREGSLEYRFNVGVEREVGSGANAALIGDVRASLRYHITDALAPALDYLGDTGSLHRLQRFEDQDHRAGPVLYGRLTDHIQFAAGYLAGLSGDAPDHTLKLALEVTLAAGARD